MATILFIIGLNRNTTLLPAGFRYNARAAKSNVPKNEEFPIDNFQNSQSEQMHKVSKKQERSYGHQLNQREMVLKEDLQQVVSNIQTKRNNPTTDGEPSTTTSPLVATKKLKLENFTEDPENFDVENSTFYDSSNIVTRFVTAPNQYRQTDGSVELFTDQPKLIEDNGPAITEQSMTASVNSVIRLLMTKQDESIDLIDAKSIDDNQSVNLNTVTESYEKISFEAKPILQDKTSLDSLVDNSTDSSFEFLTEYVSVMEDDKLATEWYKSVNVSEPQYEQGTEQNSVQKEEIISELSLSEKEKTESATQINTLNSEYETITESNFGTEVKYLPITEAIFNSSSELSLAIESQTNAESLLKNPNSTESVNEFVTQLSDNTLTNEKLEKFIEDQQIESATQIAVPTESNYEVSTEFIHNILATVSHYQPQTELSVDAKYSDVEQYNPTVGSNIDLSTEVKLLSPTELNFEPSSQHFAELVDESPTEANYFTSQVFQTNLPNNFEASSESNLNLTVVTVKQRPNSKVALATESGEESSTPISEQTNNVNVREHQVTTPVYTFVTTLSLDDIATVANIEDTTSLSKKKANKMLVNGFEANIENAHVDSYTTAPKDDSRFVQNFHNYYYSNAAIFDDIMKQYSVGSDHFSGFNYIDQNQFLSNLEPNDNDMGDIFTV